MESWRLATIADDRQAIKVAAAYYSVPRTRRDDLALISDVSGISRDVSTILMRLDKAGCLGHDAPPPELVVLINAYCRRTISKATK